MKKIQLIGEDGAIIGTWPEMPTVSSVRASIKDFGAAVDGITDDTAAINLAASTLPSGSTLTFPIGVCLISGFTFPEDKYLHFEGEGYGGYTGGSIIHGTGPIVIDTGITGGSRYSSIRKLSIQVNGGNTGVRVRNYGLPLDKVFIFGGATALEIQNSVVASYKEVICYGSDFGLKINPTGAQAVNLNEFTNVQTSAPYGAGASIIGYANARNNIFTCLDAEQSVIGLVSNGLSNTFVNFWEEGCATGVQDADSAYSVFINRYVADHAVWGVNTLKLGLGENPTYSAPNPLYYSSANGTKCKGELAVQKNIASLGAVDLFTAKLVDNYGSAIVFIEFTGTHTGGGIMACRISRLVSLNGGTPSFSIIGSDFLQYCSVSFSYVPDFGFKATITNGYAAAVSGVGFISVTGGGDDNQSTSGISELF